MDEADLEFSHLMSSQPHDRPPLPTLSEKPTAYPGCCLRLSTQLLAHLEATLPAPPSLVLSIGSGYGLLEAFLLSGDINIVGVEVSPSSNRYLPSESHQSVHGSRSLHPLAEEATTWLFIYPRRVGLVTEYLAAYGTGRVEALVWMGPKADWDEYKGCFGGWDITVQSADGIGGRPWELIAVARKMTC